MKITGRVYKADTNNGGGDGVCLFIRQGTQTLWTAEIDGADTRGVEPDLTVAVRKGSVLRFVVHKRGAIFYDTTHWDPIITYTEGKAEGKRGERFRASDGFAAKAAASWSYQVSSQRLDELCGIRIGENTIRDIAQRHGAAMNVWQNSDPDACREFRETDGFTEFTTDGTYVNTLEGWREMKVGIFARRRAGEPATADEWADRELPSPTVSVSFAAIEVSDRFGRRWNQWARRLGILDTSNITVLADGAKWIWEEQLTHLRGASGVLDIYHALQHIAETSRVLFGGGTDEAAAWLDEGRTILIAEGWLGISSFIDATRRPLRSVAKRESLDGLKAYLGSHVDHLNYADRLANGQSIGSGQIEGACRNLIGRRLKQTGARWRIRRVNRMAGLCANMYSKQWNSYWNSLLT